TRRPLRRSREPRLRRLGRNLAMAGLGFAVIELLQVPILVPISRWTMDRRIGLASHLPWRGVLRVAACFVLLDYTLWWWHRINHRIPFFWRFHSVHHVDRDMDASTALRFHFGELGLSVLFRALQIIALGADPLSVSIYQAALFASILFHHSNTRLPVPFERVLVRILVTPRMHGIHHSDYRNETDSNWASLLSAWDYLHGTIRLDVPQDQIEVGVPAYQSGSAVTLPQILAMPFLRRGDDWVRPDGSPAARAPFSPHPTRLTE
ncbi:MAG TPA: sterol desaturase family protein, partial [Thermoanaerobaculia bacterium]|nr:sterol desaturase family protein [Thermoanaerobaculia bacterium]